MMQYTDQFSDGDTFLDHVFRIKGKDHVFMQKFKWFLLSNDYDTDAILADWFATDFIELDMMVWEYRSKFSGGNLARILQKDQWQNMQELMFSFKGMVHVYGLTQE